MTSQSAGITFRCFEASIMVGETVKDRRGSSISAAIGSTALRGPSASPAPGTSPAPFRGTPPPLARAAAPPVARQPLDERGGLDERVVGDAGHRRVAGPAVDAQGERRDHLLGERADVEHAAAQDEPVAGALVDRVVGAHRVGMLLEQPLRPKPAPTSSSAAATKIRSPAGRKPSRASEAIATALAATSPFMSRAPRPQISPSRSSPDQGSTCHSAGSARTVSVCESMAASARRRCPGSARRGWRAPERARRARTARRSPRGTRAEARPPPSRSRAG